MRRYEVREAPRAALLAEIAERIRYHEHLNPDRPERAEAYRRAQQELEMGAPKTGARHTVFIVNDNCTTNYGVTEGTRAEIAAELEQYGSDRAQNGKVEKAQDIAEAMVDIENGSLHEVRVEKIAYRVVED